MNPVCCAIYDKKAQTFLSPVFYVDLATAERAYIQFLSLGNSTPAQWPEDFDLYHLGSVNPISGELIALEHPVLIITGQSAMFIVHRLRREGSGEASPEKLAVKPGKENSKEIAGAPATRSHAGAESADSHDSAEEVD